MTLKTVERPAQILVGLQIRHSYGDNAMWLGFAVIAVLAAITGAVAVRGRAAEARPVPVD